ncbi:hypothetical protein ACFP1Z_02815 [Streptomyces gamaensis]|uniref:Uncharacterized protein n=1 Tax=Streptomyces gamaensis TaxID=1763542 RepID=A0ABW0YYG7_9ACTN
MQRSSTGAESVGTDGPNKSTATTGVTGTHVPGTAEPARLTGEAEPVRGPGNVGIDGPHRAPRTPRATGAPKPARLTGKTRPTGDADAVAANRPYGPTRTTGATGTVEPFGRDRLRGTAVTSVDGTAGITRSRAPLGHVELTRFTRENGSV